MPANTLVWFVETLQQPDGRWTAVVRVVVMRLQGTLYIQAGDE